MKTFIKRISTLALGASFITNCADHPLKEIKESSPNSSSHVEATAFSPKRIAFKKYVIGQISYFYSRGPSTNSPLILYILGSGCMSQMEHFRDAPGILAEAFSEKAHIVLVEKPGVVENSHNMGTAVGCSDTFKKQFSVETWIQFHEKVLTNLFSKQKIMPHKILVIGHSEGAEIAAHLAAVDGHVTHVALLAARATNQLFDFLQKAGDENGKYGEAIKTWHDIQADPHNIEKMYEGHPYNYWSSFLPHSALEFLLKTKANVFIAQGTADYGANLESISLLVSSLEAIGKHPHYERIIGADHSFNRPGETGGFRKMLVTAGRWFLDEESH